MNCCIACLEPNSYLLWCILVPHLNAQFMDVFPSIQGTSSYLQHPNFVGLTLPGGICPWPLPWRKIGVRLQGSMPAPLFGGYLGCSAWFFLTFSAAKISELRWRSPYLYSYTLLESRLQVSLSSWNRLVSTLGWCLLEPGVLPRPLTPEASPAIGAVVSPATAQVPDPTHLSLAPQEVGLWSCWWQKSKILVQFSIEIYQTRWYLMEFSDHHQLAQDCIEISRILSIWFATIAHVCGRWCSLHTARQHGRMATRLLAPKKQSSAKSWATEQHLIEETASELMWRFVGARCFFFIITLRSFMFCFARSQVAAWEVKT